MCVCVQVCARMRVHMCTCVCVKKTPRSMCVCSCVCTCACLHVCASVCEYIWRPRSSSDGVTQTESLLAWNLPCRPGWLTVEPQRSPVSIFQHWVTSVCHHTQLLFCLFFETRSLRSSSWNVVSRPAWPRTHRYLHASASPSIGNKGVRHYTQLTFL